MKKEIIYVIVFAIISLILFLTIHYFAYLKVKNIQKDLAYLGVSITETYTFPEYLENYFKEYFKE